MLVAQSREQKALWVDGIRMTLDGVMDGPKGKGASQDVGRNPLVKSTSSGAGDLYKFSA